MARHALCIGMQPLCSTVICHRSVCVCAWWSAAAVPAYSSIRWLCPGCPSAQQQPSNPFIPRYSVPSGHGRATSQARFMTHYVLQSGKTLLTWWMERQGRHLCNHPRGIKYGRPCLGARERGEWRLEGNQRDMLGAQPLPDEWTPRCTQSIWLKPECV